MNREIPLQQARTFVFRLPPNDTEIKPLGLTLWR